METVRLTMQGVWLPGRGELDGTESTVLRCQIHLKSLVFHSIIDHPIL